ncbi:MAG: hypothetical protein IT260_23065 [Saprospiraceae bacterium]|nr:hypothetical protein [Saprospiraceae bacterium]
MSKKTTFRAFTIVESLTAVTILAIAGAATFMTLEWVLQSNPMPLKIQADYALRKAAWQTKQEKQYVDDTFEMDQWTIERKVEALPGTSHFFLLRLRALNQNQQTITTYAEFIFSP